MKWAGEAGSQRRAPGRGTTPPPSAVALDPHRRPAKRAWRPDHERDERRRAARKEALHRPAKCLSVHVCIVYVDS